MRLEYPPTLGIFADAAGNLIDAAVLQLLFDQCLTRRPWANGAPMVWRHNGAPLAGPFAASAEWRALSVALGFNLIVVAAPWIPSAPGNPSSAVGVLANLPTFVEAYEADDPIFLFGNLNGNNWSGTDEEWYDVEGQALKIFQDMGVRHAVHDDKGLVWLVNHIAERATVWTDKGADPAALEFLGSHEYVLAGYVPVMTELAQASIARAGLDLPIWLMELAWDFVHSNATPPANTRPGRPDLFLSPATDWTRLLFRWHRDRGIPALFFDFPMLFDGDLELTSIGEIFVEEVQQQAAWVSPTPAAALALGGYDADDAPVRAHQLRLSNGGTTEEAEAAALRVQDGYLFDL